MRSVGSRVVSIVVVLWLLIGVLACVQRGYFDNASDYGCAKTSTVLVTIVAGPLNYVGANPRIDKCHVPEPSK